MINSIYENIQVKSAGTTIKDKLETASLEAGLPKPGGSGVQYNTG